MSFIGLSPLDVFEVGAVVKQGVDAFKADDGSKSQYQEIRHGHNSRIQALQNLKALAESSDPSPQADATIQAVEKSIAHHQKQQARLEKYDNSLGPDAASSFRQAARVLQFSFSGAKQHREREAHSQSASTAATLDAILLTSKISQEAKNETLAAIIAAKDEIIQQATSSVGDLSGKLDTISSVLCDILGHNQQKVVEDVARSGEQLATRLETILRSESTQTRTDLGTAIESINRSIVTTLSTVETMVKEQQDTAKQQELQMKELLHRLEAISVEANFGPPIPPVVGGLHSLRVLCVFNSWCSFEPEALSYSSTASMALKRVFGHSGTIFVASSLDHDGLKIGFTSQNVEQRLKQYRRHTGIRYTATFKVGVAAARAADALLRLELLELDIRSPAGPVVDSSGRRLREIYNINQELAVRIIYQVCQLLKAMDVGDAFMYVQRVREAIREANRQNPWR